MAVAFRLSTAVLPSLAAPTVSPANAAKPALSSASRVALLPFIAVRCSVTPQRSAACRASTAVDSATSTGTMADAAAPATDVSASAGDVDSRSRCRICAAVTATTVGGMREQMAQAKAAGADTAELRVDHLTEFDPSVDLPALLNDRCLPVIVTCRPTWEGGKYADPDEERRQQVLAMAMDMGAEFIDVELQVASDFIQKHVAPRRAAGDGVTATRVIVSSHNYNVTPPLEELRALVARIEAAGADIVKFATTATDITDNARVFQILKEAQRPTIALVMGPKGLISRLLAPKFNAFLTFGAITPGAESAPGQPTVAELAGTYRLAGVGPETHVFGLVGNPVGHSKGPVLHNAALRHVGYDGVYVPFLVDNVPEFLKTFDSPDFKGFSVTIPHKLAALECCQDVEPLAKSIGAANTIIRGEDGRLMGYNTDCMSAIEAIEDGLRQAEGGSSSSPEASSSPLAGRLFVVVGAGGAGRALAFGAKERGADVIITNRSYGKAEALAAAVGGTAVPLPSVSGDGDVAAGGDELAAVLQEMQRGRSGHAVLANTTSVGMHPHVEDTPVSKAVLQECSLVFDAVYTPMETRLLKEAKQAGAATVSGVEMFVGQAARQFELFTGKPASNLPGKTFRQSSADNPPPSSRYPHIMEAEEPPRARTLRNAAKRWSVPAVLHPASGRLVPMDDWAISAAVSAHSDGAPAAAHSGASSGHDDFLKNLTSRSRKWIGGARTTGRSGTASFRDADNAVAATGAAPAAPPSLNNVPDPVLLKILMRVESPRDRAACALVSPRWFWLEKRSRRAMTHLELSSPLFPLPPPHPPNTSSLCPPPPLSPPLVPSPGVPALVLAGEAFSSRHDPPGPVPAVAPPQPLPFFPLSSFPPFPLHWCPPGVPTLVLAGEAFPPRSDPPGPLPAIALPRVAPPRILPARHLALPQLLSLPPPLLRGPAL
ncbi:unnamed protein product [Closterium sp. NIES-54]